MSMVGKVLAHYEITSQLGKGGMGEVYQAKDQVLGRDVAIKVLPEEFTRDADRVARFQREAKLLASLNHPNIATIHGLEESGGKQFLVMELVEGETLADSLKRGAIPVDESLKLALQIAEALEAAHEKGVIHRDLKPANIKVTPDGKVKVLDFGLAKAFAGEQTELNLSNSPTLSNAATQQGVILGTAAYMSPEQARGKPVDKRTDIWAFGCVLFEMLTGQAAFRGEDVGEILASVIKGDVKLDQLPPNFHPRVREVIIRCLQKELRKRYSSITDARYEIEQALTDPNEALTRGAVELPIQPKRVRTFAWIAVTAILGVIIGGLAVWKLKAPEQSQVTRFYFELPKDQQFTNLNERVLAVSPDGRQFVYCTSAGIYWRSMNEMDARLIPGTGGYPQRPFFSPDGKWVGYWSSTENQLKKISVRGGPPVLLTDSPSTGAIRWSEGGTIIFCDLIKGVMRIPDSGGTPEILAKVVAPISPQILPDERSLLYTFVYPPHYKVMVSSINPAKPKELFEGADARYIATGHIVYSLGKNLFATPFDPAALKVTGDPIPLPEVVWSDLAPQFAVSDSGTLVYIPWTGASAAPVERTLVWVDRTGREEPLAVEPKAYRNPRISPDGTKLALSIETAGKNDIWTWDLVRKNLTQLTFDKNGSVVPLWTRDRKRIVFSSDREEGRNGIYWKAADGSGKDELLGLAGGLPQFALSWAGDGHTLVLAHVVAFAPVRFDIGTLSMEGGRKGLHILGEKYSESQAQISRDGRWIAYTSDESGRNEIYVRPFPEVNSGGRWKVSTDGGESPLWSRDGGELFYRNGDAVLAVTVQTEPSFSPASPETLFRGKYVSSSNPFTDPNPWDISPDGRRFLMMKEPGSAASSDQGPRRIHVVLNWFEELKQRVPTK